MVSAVKGFHCSTVYFENLNYHCPTPLFTAPPITPPPIPTVQHINITSVNITWSYTTTTPPTQFIVQILSSSYNDTKFHNLTKPISETHYVYTDLEYSIFYQFRIVAYREGTLSEPSEPSSIFDNGMTGTLYTLIPNARGHIT